jgi:propanol-preferring alcohol dehydrogenase
VIADDNFSFELDPTADPVSLAPLFCAGLIGWRSLKKAGEARKIGLYGFGATAHIIAQICTWEDREVYAFTRKGDLQAQSLPRNSVPPGRAARRKDRPRNWTLPSFSLRSAILDQKPYVPCAKEAALFVAVFI